MPGHKAGHDDWESSATAVLRPRAAAERLGARRARRVTDGAIVSVAANAEPAGAERLPGIALPGLPNLHCHAFQRGMAGLAERRGPATDSFWTWREVMYRFLARLTPDDVEAIAAFAYMEMLETGFTPVAEFHYLHHDIDGRPYADLGEMAARIAAAAAQTGIGLTLLPSFYAYGGFGGAPPTAGQRRFLNDPDAVSQARRAHAARSWRTLPDARVGIAPHSLRAVTPETLRIVVDAAPAGPIHIHAAEQTKEVDESIAQLGRRPVEWLLDFGADARWCLVHATHMTAAGNVAARGLGRGRRGSARSPKHRSATAFSTARAISLPAGGSASAPTPISRSTPPPSCGSWNTASGCVRRERNVMAGEGASTGRTLFARALAGGAQALARSIGAIEPGRRADIVLLDAEHPDLAGDGDRWLDGWIFVAGRAAVKACWSMATSSWRTGATACAHRSRRATRAS